MSNDPTDIAQNPAELMAQMDCVDNSIIAARFGDPPGGMICGMAPAGIESAGQVCEPQNSVLGMQLSESLGPSAHVPKLGFGMAAANNVGGVEPLTPTPEYKGPELTG